MAASRRQRQTREDEAMRQARTDASGRNGTTDAFAARLDALESQLRSLLDSPPIRFDERCRSALPEAPGTYRIFDPTKPGETVRAGRTKTAAGGLRQRVCQNHLMGNQAGNLRAQLVAGGLCTDLEAAKGFIRGRLAMQILVVEDEDQRVWLEHFVLGVLQPRYCDRASRECLTQKERVGEVEDRCQIGAQLG